MLAEPEIIFAIRPENVRGIMGPLPGNASNPPAHLEWAFVKHPMSANASQEDWFWAREIHPPEHGQADSPARVFGHYSVRDKEGHRNVWAWIHLGSDGQTLDSLQPKHASDFAVIDSKQRPVFVPIDLQNLSTASLAAEPLMLQTGSFEQTERALLADASLSADVRRAAIDCARAMNSNWRWLGNQAEAMATKDGATDADFERALALARECVRIHEERCFSPEGCFPGWYALNHLVVVQYHAGRYADALSTIAKCESVWAGCINGKNPNCIDAAYKAMAHYRLGDTEKARSELERAKTLLAEHPPAVAGAAAEVAQARALIAWNP